MSISKLFTGSVATCDGNLLRDVTQVRFAEGLGVDRELGNQPTPSFVCVKEGKPMASLTSRQIATALGQMESARVWGCITDWTNPFVLYFQKRGGCSTIASGGAHRTFSLAEGLLVAKKISCGFRGHAEIELEAIAQSTDGQTHPFTLAVTASLPTLGVDDERFTLGPMTVGAVSLEGVQNFEIDFGVTIEAVGGDSDIFDTYVAVKTWVPQMRWSGLDLDWVVAAGIPLGGQAATQANTTAFLRKRAAGAGKFVAAGTAEHISFAAAGLVYAEEEAGSGTENATCTVVLDVVDDGTNAMITIDTTAAIA